MSSNIYVGLEIGTSKICVAVGEVFSNGDIQVMGVGTAPSRGVRKGEIVDQKLALACLADAVASAEDTADVSIGTVFLAVTGPHIHSMNSGGTLVIPEKNNQIDRQDLIDVRKIARDGAVPPPDEIFLHTMVRHYEVDQQNHVLNPEGMYARELIAHFHFVTANRNRIHNSIRCVRELPLDVEEVVFAGFAAAQIVATRDQRAVGVLVVDFGAGTTDFVLYEEGSPKISGSVAVGGDHISNDIVQILKLPRPQAEMLKVKHGSCRPGRHGVSTRIELPEDGTFAGREVERELLDQIIESRVRETFEVIKTRIGEDGNRSRLGGGVVITGGSSLLHGLDDLVQEVFGVPVKVPKSNGTTWLSSLVDNPRYVTAIGLIRSAQLFDEERAQRGAMSWLRRKLSDIFGTTKPAAS